MNYKQAMELPAYYGNDLGAVWTAEATTFKLWAPTAKSVTIQLYCTGTNEEPGAAFISECQLQKSNDGVWELCLYGNLAGTYYSYHLNFGSKSTDLVDPYARACGANGKRAMVVDLDSAAPDGWKEDCCREILPHERSVWECHVADFTADPHSGIPELWRGKYMGFTVKDSTLNNDLRHETCLNYLKKLGVSYIQLLPIYDYASVDETDETEREYNWGYDPQNFNVPEGKYATDAYHGEIRIKECRAMIQALHRAGLGVVMDVVYNHTYHRDSNLERSVPGYWNRRTPRGTVTNGSGCGNDLATEHPMVRKYIVDSVVYWAKEYHIDGFRFDLMALLDVDTMNAIREALDQLPNGKNILMYGEPWMGGSTNMHGRPSDKGALDALSDRIGFFCDNTRDAIKGNTFDAAGAGYINGNYNEGWRLLHAIGAWQGGEEGFKPKAAQQVVQYVSAHDNFTLWDKLLAVAGKNDYHTPYQDLIRQNKLAAGMYLTFQGLPFMQAGEEHGRTKCGDGNSYKGPIQKNRLDWQRAWESEFAALTDYYRGLLEIRRTYPCLSGTEQNIAVLIMPLPGWLIGWVPEHPLLNNQGELVIYYNPETEPRNVTLPGGNWKTLCDGTHAGAQPFGPVHSGEFELAPVSTTILVNIG